MFCGIIKTINDIISQIIFPRYLIMAEGSAKVIGQQIAKLRKEKDLTQEELANKLCITAQAVSKWERGVGLPDATLLPSIAEALGVSIGLLFGEETQQVPPFPESCDGLPLVAKNEQVGCYSDKKVLSASDTEITFADGSRADFESRTVINRGRGEIRFYELEFVQWKVDAKVTSLEKRFSDFESLYLSCSIPCTARVLLADGSFEGVKATGSAVFISLIEADVSGSTLEVRIKSLNSGISHEDKQQNKLDVYIPATCNKSAKLKISGSANINAYSDFETLTMSVSGSGNICAKNAGDASASIAGSGIIEFGEVSKSCETSIAGSGVINAKSFGKSAAVKISGSGEVSAESAGSLSANIAGSGDISVRNINGELSFVLSGSGELSCGGNADKLKVKISGSGDLNGKHLTVGDANIDLAGASKVELGRIVNQSLERLSKSSKLIVHQRG